MKIPLSWFSHSLFIKEKERRFSLWNKIIWSTWKKWRKLLNDYKLELNLKIWHSPGDRYIYKGYLKRRNEMSLRRKVLRSLCDKGMSAVCYVKPFQENIKVPIHQMQFFFDLMKEVDWGRSSLVVSVRGEDTLCEFRSSGPRYI